MFILPVRVGSNESLEVKKIYVIMRSNIVTYMTRISERYSFGK
jgi:hypothetical protein